MHYIGRKSEFAFRNMEMCMANAIVQLLKRILETARFVRFSFYRRRACGGFFSRYALTGVTALTAFNIHK